MNFCDLGKQLIGIQLGETVIGMNPVDELGHGDADGIVNRTVDARSHDFFFVLETRPAGVLSFHEFELEARAHGNFHRASGNFAVAHGGVAVTEVEQSARCVHRQIKRVADRNFWRVHIAAKFRGNDGAASFAICGGHANAPQKRVQRKAYFETGIESLKRSSSPLLIDGIEPHALGQRLRFQNGSVVRGIDGTEAGGKRADALLTVDL